MAEVIRPSLPVRKTMRAALLLLLSAASLSCGRNAATSELHKIFEPSPWHYLPPDSPLADSVVQIRDEDGGRGTAFWYDSTHVITNHHVVAGCRRDSCPMTLRLAAGTVPVRLVK